MHEELFVEALTEDKFKETVFPDVFLDLSLSSRPCSSSTANPSDPEVSDLFAFNVNANIIGTNIHGKV